MNNSKEQLQKQLEDLINSLIDEGVLDEERLRSTSYMDTNKESYLSGIEKVQQRLDNLTEALEQQNADFKTLHHLAFFLWCESLGLGAKKVYVAANFFMVYCRDQQMEGCRKALQHAKSEYLIAKDQIETLLQLRQQLSDAKE